jgi:hypothetical protein
MPETCTCRCLISICKVISNKTGLEAARQIKKRVKVNSADCFSKKNLLRDRTMEPVALVVVGNSSCSSNLLKLINRWRRSVANCQ